MVHVFKNWKLLFENIYENTCEWKNALKCVKCCLKTENDCLKTQTKHPVLVLSPKGEFYLDCSLDSGTCVAIKE